MSVYIRSYVPGTGRIRSITGTNPAAGVEISETVPAGVVWDLRSIRFFFTTDATVANRRPALLLDNGANVFWYHQVTNPLAASLTRVYVFAQQGTAVDSTGTHTLLPLLLNSRMLAGYRIRTETSGIQAGDDYAAPQMLVEEWFQE